MASFVTRIWDTGGHMSPLKAMLHSRWGIQGQYITALALSSLRLHPSWRQTSQWGQASTFLSCPLSNWFTLMGVCHSHSCIKKQTRSRHLRPRVSPCSEAPCSISVNIDLSPPHPATVSFSSLTSSLRVRSRAGRHLDARQQPELHHAPVNRTGLKQPFLISDAQVLAAMWSCSLLSANVEQNKCCQPHFIRSSNVSFYHVRFSF